MDPSGSLGLISLGEGHIYIYIYIHIFMGFRAYGGSRHLGFEARVSWIERFRPKVEVLWVEGLGFRVEGLGLRVEGLGLRV